MRVLIVIGALQIFIDGNDDDDEESGGGLAVQTGPG